LDFEGRWTRHTLMPPLLRPDPLETGPPPIWLAALGPRMTALAGEVADGLLVHPFASRRHVAEANLPNLEIGMRAAGRGRDEVTVVVGVIVGLYETDDEARRADAAVRGMLGFYGSTPAYRPVLEAHGWGDLQPELRALTKADRWGELGARYDDEQVRTLAVIGTPGVVARELHARFGHLADRLALSLPGPRRPELLAALADAYAAG
ncbi:MAG: LLM class flavin-dependent oxidoreductase, partial [Actinomycetota bacterium]